MYRIFFPFFLLNLRFFFIFLLALHVFCVHTRAQIVCIVTQLGEAPLKGKSYFLLFFPFDPSYPEAAPAHFEHLANGVGEPEDGAAHALKGDTGPLVDAVLTGDGVQLAQAYARPCKSGGALFADGGALLN